MPSPRLRAPRQRDPIDLSPDAELDVRLSGQPAAVAARLAAIDAEYPGQLHGLLIGSALAAIRDLPAASPEGKAEARNRAVGRVAHAQQLRRATR